ncbi:MAG TPA: hydantoinase B/oxoprolinase family protein [Dermatophilaceae bacterium]|nr:hydantoinase B/oxoprolinase family protein [Dermatophilaceae bacterium]
MTGPWEFWVDRGGTFTDVVARRGDGALVTHKLLSENAKRYEDAAIAGIREVLGLGDSEPIPVEDISAVKMGTTVATNALLERKGEPTVLVTTRGFADAQRIAYQNRPRIFDRRIELPDLLHSVVVEVTERLDARGEVVTPLDPGSLRPGLEAAFDRGFRSVAVVLMHAFRNPGHELQIGKLARDMGFTQISLSHEVSPLMKLVSRGDTTIVDAYLSPILRRYVDQVSSALPGVRCQFMRSSGGLTEAHHFRGKDAILSGPAGGIVGMARTAEAADLSHVIGFDMGGTSTDVSHYAGEFERQYDTQIAGVRVRAPVMSIHTVAAGGGSILQFDGQRYRVGPSSAGADPGPVAYRRGGPLTVTDANVMLGRIQPAHFPAVFGDDGDEPLDAELVARAFRDLADTIEDGRSPEEVAAGFLRIAVSNMADAIKKVSVQRGHDITRYTLSTFGGAGGQHACAVADRLGMTRILIHPFAGVLSAYGMGLADVTATRETAVEAPLSVLGRDGLDAAVAPLIDAGRRELADQGVPMERMSVVRRAHLKYAGTDTAVEVPCRDIEDMLQEFERVYRRRFSFLMPERPVIVEAVSVELTARTESHPDEVMSTAREGALRPASRVRMYTDEWAEVDLFRREELSSGDVVEGPAIIAEANATTVVDLGWQARVTDHNHLMLERTAARAGEPGATTDVDPVLLELFNNLFMSIAEQMGERLRATANSVNIKERLDFSCALFDPDGHLVANAPHIPVHLGSMGESIKAVIEANAGRMRPGDSYVLNNPYRGGTHLPDITVVTPVFDGRGRVLFYVASRGHHADVGGLTPGSMPPFSRRVEEEGVLIDNALLTRDGRMLEHELHELLTGGQYPARSPDDNLADLRAQLAANEKGVTELHALVEDFGLDVVMAYMGHVRENAAEAVRRVIANLPGGAYRYELDSGAVIKVVITVDHETRSAHIDFTGTSDQQPDNSNAPSSVTMAAILYVLRSLVDDDIPLNAGCLEPVEVTIPQGSLLAPCYPAAVVAGNVETSQAVTGALYAALGVQAEGSGTMNNFAFGDDRYQYYETVASGSGAGPDFDGTDVVQTHMTNSRLTDPEVLEWRFPVRLESYEIRHGSGGSGRHHGGSGGRRRLRFLTPMTVTLLSSHRRIAPYGMAGGAPGALGRQWIEHTDGTTSPVAGRDSVEVEAADVFVIETPGGGGYGPPPETPDLGSRRPAVVRQDGGGSEVGRTQTR